MSTPDPHKLVVTTPGVAHMDAELIDAVAPDATVVRLQAQRFQQELLSAIEQQVLKNGTQKILVVHAHGTSLLISADPAQHRKDISIDIYLPDLLAGLLTLQDKLGVKIADRIAFFSCDVMTDLSASDVGFLRYTARTLGAEVVGPTTKWLGGKYQEGELANFLPDGSVRRDKMSPTGLALLKERFHQVLASTAGFVVGQPSAGKSDSWFYCHEQQTQEAGAACQASNQLRNYQAAEAKTSVAALGTEVVYIPSDIPEKLQLSALGAASWLAVFDRVKNIFTTDEIRSARRAIESSKDWSSPVRDEAAVDAHQRFLRSLAPKDRKLLEEHVDAYVREISAFPQRRTDSRDTMLLRLANGPEPGDADATSTPNPNIRGVAMTLPASHL